MLKFVEGMVRRTITCWYWLFERTKVLQNIARDKLIIIKIKEFIKTTFHTSVQVSANNINLLKALLTINYSSLEQVLNIGISHG